MTNTMREFAEAVTILSGAMNANDIDEAFAESAEARAREAFRALLADES